MKCKYHGDGPCQSQTKKQGVLKDYEKTQEYDDEADYIKEVSKRPYHFMSQGQFGKGDKTNLDAYGRRADR